METETDFFTLLKSIEDDEELKALIFKNLEIEDNPKREKLYSLACDYGHSSGNCEIWSYACDLVDLIK